MRKLLFLTFSVLLFHSCGWSRYEGFNRTLSGLHYRLNYIGDGDRTPKKGDHIHFTLVLKNLQDDVLYRNTNSAAGGRQWQKFVTTTKGAITEGLDMLQLGDSATFIMEREALALEREKLIQFVPDTLSMVKAEVKLTGLKSPEEFEELQKRLAWKEDEEMNEQIRLNAFLQEMGLSDSNFTNGIYLVNHKKGKGPTPRNGNTLLIHYKAGFIDGSTLDNTYFLGHPLEVRLGDPDQMLKGFEVGIRQMREGGHATFIIPSLFAFGEKGSTNGSVKPYQTLIYEVELVKVI